MVGMILIGLVVSAAEYFPDGVLGDTADQHQFRAD